MTTDLDHAISSAISDLVAAAPEPLDTPSVATITARPVSRRPRLLLATAASAAFIGGGVAVLALRGGSPAELGGAGTSDAAGATAPAVSTTVTASANVGSCDSASTTVTPNVAGQPLPEAIRQLAEAGLIANVIRENRPAAVPGEASPDLDFVVMRQDIVPDDIVPCDTTLELVAADRPGPVHIVQAGETWASIAADEGLTVDLLLEFNGLTTAELALTGETVDTPLDAGTAVRLARVGSVTDTTVPTTP